MLPNNREPTTPGETLSKEFLQPMKLTQAKLAERMGVSVQTVNLLVNGRRAVTSKTALLLAKAFGTSPELWMNLQTNHGLWVTRREMQRAGRL